MPYLILPSRRRLLPQSPARINPNHWILIGAYDVWDHASRWRGHLRGTQFTIPASATVDVTPAGPFTKLNGFSSLNLTGLTGLNAWADPRSMWALGRTAATRDAYDVLMTADSSGFPWCCRIQLSSTGNAWQGSDGQYNAIGGTVAANTTYGVGYSVWGNSDYLYVNGVQVASETSSAATSATVDRIYLGGYKGQASAWWNGSIGLAIYWNALVGAEAYRALQESPAQIYVPDVRRIYFDAGAGGGAVTLVHDDSTQAQSADNTLLTTQSFLIVGDATQSHTSENVVLDASVSTNLVVQESTQAHTSENAVLTASSNLVLQDATQAQASDNVILTSAHSIIIQECTHNHTSENINLDSGLILTVADALSTQQVDNLELLAACLLSIDDSNHTQLTDSTDLSTLHSLNIAETTHAITSESPTLTIPGSGTGATAEEIAAAVLAALEATTIPVDIKKVNSVSITGIGTDPNPWRAV